MRKKLRILIFSTIVFIISLSLWYYFKNVFSKEILKLEILGPSEIVLNQEVEYTVKYKNNGNIRLEEPKLIFEYPSDSIVILESEGEESQQNFLRAEKNLEDIYPGEEKTFTFRARLFGKEGEVKTAKAFLSYRPKNLRARYESSTTFSTLIKSVPLNFEFDLPSKIDSGKEIPVKINYFSNLEYPLSDLRIKIEYPKGFEIKESNPKGIAENEWQIPLLNKAEGGRINILGTLTGEVGETKIFRATLGVWREENFVLLKEITRGVQIAQPLIFISQKINDSPQYIASPGEYLHYEISFKNTGESVLENLLLVVQLDKQLVDMDTLRVESAQVQKEAGAIIWDTSNLSSLKFLPSLEEGKVDFWIKIKNEIPYNSYLRTKILVGSVKEEFINKINTQLFIAQEGYFTHGPFQNTGPIPPTVGQITTYTVLWKARNLVNDVKNLKFKAVLPPYVSLTGKFSPNDARFTFDSFTREIIWEVGDLSAGSSTPEFFFQIAFNPLSEQKGQTPELISQLKVIADDVFTGQTLQFERPGFNTSLPHDQNLPQDRGIVK
jgi:hypothetical protein